MQIICVYHTVFELCMKENKDPYLRSTTNPYLRSTTVLLICLMSIDALVHCNEFAAKEQKNNRN